MKNTWYTIKVWDILHNLWVKDTLIFSNKFSTYIPQLVAPWMSFKATLQSLSDEQLLIYLQDISVPVETHCDHCWKGFQRIYSFDRIETKAVLWTIDSDEYEIEIDNKNKTIDIEKWLWEYITVSLPVVKMCNNCWKLWIQKEEEIPETNNIVRKNIGSS